VGSLNGFIYDTTTEIVERIKRRRLPFRLNLLFEQTNHVGVQAVPLIILVSLFLGLTMTLLTGYQLQKFGAEGLVPGLVAISFARELGALFTGIITAARSGSAFTAELSTMTVSDEVDAIETMGIGPLRYLVAPRVLASILMLPCLTVVSNVAALCGSSFISRVQFNISPSTFFDATLVSLQLRDVWSGVIKSLIFGFLIGIIACHKGLRVKGGAQGVGQATRSSVVITIAVVIGVDMLVNVILIRMFP
jgi:phospholipid/cholesterol/gamma-HCH transport system permease protein